MNLREKIESGLNMALVNLGLPAVDFVVELTSDLVNGDYTTNLAMVGAREVKLSPLELAEKIKLEFLKLNLSEIADIKIAKPGFINFFIAESVLLNNLKLINQSTNYGQQDKLSGQKVIIEYTDPNPFKEFHIGHLMPNVIGESLCRLTTELGAEVKRVNYQGDVGLHVAKAIWGIESFAGEPTNMADLARGYVVGAKAYDTNENIKSEIDKLNQLIYSHSDLEIEKIYQNGRQTSLDYFETIYDYLGTKFDHYFFESEMADFGKRVVNEGLINGIFTASEGAVVFKGEDYGLHTRVFINRLGLPTYEAKELGLMKLKDDYFKYDQSIIVTGNEIKEYFKVLLKVGEFIFPELAKKQEHLSHGMLRLSTGKMSSRTGEVVTANELIKKITVQVETKMKEADQLFNGSTKDLITKQIVVGAIKYSILKQDTGRDIIFDFDKSISFEGNSGPYLQYMAVRAQAIMKRIDKMPTDFESVDDELVLPRLMVRFWEVIERAQFERAPHLLATYLYELASAFSSYYAHHQIIGGENEAYRLILTNSFNRLLTKGLYLLGIEVPAKM